MMFSPNIFQLHCFKFDFYYYNIPGIDVVNDGRQELSFIFIFYPSVHPIDPTTFIEKNIFSSLHCNVSVGLFLDTLFCSVGLFISEPVLYFQSLKLCNKIFVSGSVRYLTLFIKLALFLLGPVYFHVHLKISLSISSKNQLILGLH